MGRLEGSTQSIWNLAFISRCTFPPFLPSSSALKFPFPTFSSPSFFLLLFSSVSQCSQSYFALWWPAGESSIHSFHLLTFSSLHFLSALCTSPLVCISLSPLFIFLIWFPLCCLPPLRMPSPLLSTNLLFLYLCERGPEHILISRFHISALPEAPSLVVQPWLSVWLRVHGVACLNIHAKLLLP